MPIVSVSLIFVIRTLATNSLWQYSVRSIPAIPSNKYVHCALFCFFFDSEWCRDYMSSVCNHSPNRTTTNYCACTFVFQLDVFIQLLVQIHLAISLSVCVVCCVCVVYAHISHSNYVINTYLSFRIDASSAVVHFMKCVYQWQVNKNRETTVCIYVYTTKLERNRSQIVYFVRFSVGQREACHISALHVSFFPTSSP